MTSGTVASNLIRLDRVEFYGDRSGPFWSLALRSTGFLGLLKRTPQSVVLLLEDDVDEPLFALPLELVRYLGRPPAPFGVAFVADMSLRLDFDGTRKIVVLTGISQEAGDEQERTLWDLRTARLRGDLDPVGLVEAAIVAGKGMAGLPGAIRRAREARRAWVSILDPSGDQERAPGERTRPEVKTGSAGPPAAVRRAPSGASSAPGFAVVTLRRRS